VKLAYKPGSVQGSPPWAVIPLGRRLPGGSSNLPGGSASHAIAPLFGLAPDGVWSAVPVTRSAVGSYPTVSPSPDPARPSKTRGSRPALLQREEEAGLSPRSSSTRLCRLRRRSPACRPSADCSLFHFPSPRGARPLAGILLCGARTFLYMAKTPCSDCPASFTGASYLRGGKSGRSSAPPLNPTLCFAPFRVA
jgi:hypothetical protein